MSVWAAGLTVPLTLGAAARVRSQMHPTAPPPPPALLRVVGWNVGAVAPAPPAPPA